MPHLKQLAGAGETAPALSVFQQTTRIGQKPTLVAALPSCELVSSKYLLIRVAAAQRRHRRG
jgi:hypothetical protein